ncbi:hypothetical protein ES703_61657 [subsurface metagenome]
MEELDFQGLLDHFKLEGFQRGEQVILGNFGTVQTLLSLIFMVPVNVYDIKMEELNREIIRTVHLRAGGPDQAVVCEAKSRIPIDRNGFDVVHDIRSGKLGLGQIVVVNEIPNHRVLNEVARDDFAFWRTYTIEGPGLFIEIHEHFPREPFEAVGWIEAQEG